ncbi:hypothetical protein DL93DRAFT_1123862 [Clavulina sp. PMI_390]|nr:hypothetical protein DL93DRAFT_1123862 [Clavulina sp. PMI_390]
MQRTAQEDGRLAQMVRYSGMTKAMRVQKTPRRKVSRRRERMYNSCSDQVSRGRCGRAPRPTVVERPASAA